MKHTHKKPQAPLGHILMAVTCMLVIAAGAAGMNHLANSKKTPVRKEILKKNLSVLTIPVLKQDTAVYLTGYGQATPVKMVDICPGVSGRIVEKNENLDQGRQVQKGQLLFKINTADYDIQAEKAAIAVTLQLNQISQLKISYQKDQGRLDAVKQNILLAKTEFSRLKSLYNKESFEILGLRETNPDSNWFSNLEKIPCHVETVTGSVSAHVPAVIDRAVAYFT